jgi:hypothetical protein
MLSIALRVLKDRLDMASDQYWAGQAAIQELASEAWIALVEGRKAKAITGVRQAADLEGRSGKHVAIENRLSPMRELLGELLMDAQEPVQALKELETSLRNNPNRYCSFAGAARAADRAGDGYYEKLVTLAGNADTPRPDLIVAKQYLTSK